MKNKTYMGRDQYGNTFHDLGPHPRKELMTRLCNKHVEKMHVDTKDGRTIHTGYIIGGLWITLYEIQRFEREV